MFERFTADARQAVTLAQGAAAALDADAIGPEHLLLALALDETSVAGRALASLGVSHAQLEDGVCAARRPDGPDPQALALVGVDLDDVRARADATFGAGALDRALAAGRARRRRSRHPLTPGARSALAGALEEAMRHRHRRIDPGHLLLAAVEGDDRRPDSPARLLAALGAAPRDVRAAVVRVWSSADAA